MKQLFCILFFLELKFAFPFETSSWTHASLPLPGSPHFPLSSLLALLFCCFKTSECLLSPQVSSDIMGLILSSGTWKELGKDTFFT